MGRRAANFRGDQVMRPLGRNWGFVLVQIAQHLDLAGQIHRGELETAFAG